MCLFSYAAVVNVAVVLEKLTEAVIYSVAFQKSLEISVFLNASIFTGPQKNYPVNSGLDNIVELFIPEGDVSGEHFPPVPNLLTEGVINWITKEDSIVPP